ncbi:MAG: lysine--tRNA ligase, partial [Vicinamibacterales bacterium]
MSEEDLYLQRRQHLEAVEALGYATYPNRFDASHAVATIVADYGPRDAAWLDANRTEVTTAGRILGIRSFGKANFLVIADGSSRVQVYVRQDSLAERAFALFKALDFGDYIGVDGHVFRTKTNELTVWASNLHFLVKCFHSLPEKWHGLQDVETRYRQRYLDLIVNPPSRAVFEVRSRLIASLRRFFDERGFLEVETPMMQPIAGGALARPFVTHHNALDMTLYLRIAPELYLKRLVVGGMHRVYEINRNFRNEGISTQHNPEFTMLEFYWAFVDYEQLMTATEALIERVALETVGTTAITFGDHAISLKAPFRRLSMRDAVRERASERLGRVVEAAELRSAPASAALAAALGIDLPANLPAGKIVMELFEALWETSLIEPTFVYDFPTVVSP